MDDKKLKTVPLNKIKISDQFWNRYIHLVKDVLIPYQWDILNDRLPDVETSHCIENFKIAAGETDGDFEGAVFQDTDVAKWLEAVAYSLAAEPDEHLSYLADKTINLIGRAQCEDGYLNTYFTIKDPSKRWTNLKEGHELYTAGHMTEAAVAYYKATGKTEFLDIMKKFADLICKTFGPDEGQIHGYPGHQEIELALIRLYHVTGEKKYLETAKYFIDTRGVGENYFLEEEKRPEYKQIFPEFAGYDPRYSQSHEPVREQKTAEGHAVRAVYMYCAMADLAYEYKDKELLDACKTLWEDMTKRQMYITGSIGASGLLERFTTDYDLPNNCNYSETCASIGLALFGRRMAQITKDASYMDVVERALYNTLLSGIAQDGKSFFYVNPLEVWPDNCIDRTSKEHVKPVRQKWFGVACCPPNIARTLASMGQYIYFTDKNTAYVNLYISNEAQIELEEGALKIQIESDLTNTGHIRMAITPDGEGEHRLALRIPDYVKTYTIKRDGKIGLMDLTDAIAPYKDNVVESRLDIYGKDGKYYGFPTHVGTTVAFYNDDLLKEAGIDYTTIKTWDDFKAAGVKYHEKTGKNFACAETTAQWMVNLMLAQKGTDYLDKDGNLDLTNDKVVEVLQYIKDMQDAGALATVAGGQPDNEEAYPEYNSGNFAVQIMPFWQTSRFTNYMSDLEGKIAIAAPPVFGDNDAVKTIGGGGTGTAVVKSSKNADLAAEVFAYIKLSEDANKEVWNVLGFDPVNTSVWTDTDLTQNPDNQFVKYFKTKPFDTLLELQDSIGGLASYTSSKYPSINNEFCTTTLNNIYEEGMDVKDALKQSQETLENEFGDK